MDVQLLDATVRMYLQFVLFCSFPKLTMYSQLSLLITELIRRLASLNASLFNSQPVLGMNGIDNQIVFNIGLIAPMQQFVQSGQQQQQYAVQQQQGHYAAQPVQYATNPIVMTAVPAHAAPMDRGQPVASAPPQYVMAEAVAVSAPYEKN